MIITYPELLHKFSLLPNFAISAINLCIGRGKYDLYLLEYLSECNYIGLGGRNSLILNCFPCLFHWSSGPGVGSSRLGLRTTAAIIFGRLVLVPPAGLGIVTLADKLGFIPAGDKMFKFILLIQHTMPTSVLSGNIYLFQIPG